MTRTIATRLLVVLALTVSACAASRLPSNWSSHRRLTSRHVFLETDVGIGRAYALLDAAEDIHAEYAALYGDTSPELAAPVRLLVFEDLADYGRFQGRRLPSKAEILADRRRIESDGWTVTGDDLDLPRGRFESGPHGERPRVAVPDGASVIGALRHEFAHRFNIAVHGPLPAWLDEGLAEYLRLLSDPAGAETAAAEFRAAVAARSAISLPELLTLRAADFAQRKDVAYRTAWALARRLFAEGRIVTLSDLSSATDAAYAIAGTVPLDELLGR